MPKDGFKSLTVSGPVYDHIHAVYQANKEPLKLHGINSFAAFCTHLMRAGLEIKLKPIKQNSLTLQIPKEAKP